MVVKEKAKYKETEIGIIPEDWDLVDFDNAFDFLSTATYSRSELVINGDIYYIHYGDIHTKFNHFLDFNQEELCGVDKIKAAKYSLIQDGDLVLADASEDYEGIGKGVEIKNLSGKKAIAGLHTFLLRDKKNLFSKGFKGYFHSNRLIKKQLDRLATGLKVYGISKYSLKTILIPVPPPLEQTAIANSLNDIDQLINSLERIIIKKLNIKQGAIQELLSGKKRLPGFAKSNKFKQTEIGIIPEDWDLKQIGDVCQIFGRIGFRGYTVNDIVRSTEGAVTISPSNIQDGKMDFAKCTYISWFKYEESPEIKIFNGDILLVKTGSTFGKTAIVSGLKEKATVNPQIVVLKKITIDNYFLGYLIGFEVVQNQIKTSIVGGAIPTLSQKQVASFLIPLPHTKEEQTAIAQVLSDMDLEINALETKLTKYQQIKQGMMENLLTGRIRLV